MRSLAAVALILGTLLLTGCSLLSYEGGYRSGYRYDGGHAYHDNDLGNGLPGYVHRPGYGYRYGHAGLRDGR